MGYISHCEHRIQDRYPSYRTPMLVSTYRDLIGGHLLQLTITENGYWWAITTGHRPEHETGPCSSARKKMKPSKTRRAFQTPAISGINGKDALHPWLRLYAEHSCTTLERNIELHITGKYRGLRCMVWCQTTVISDGCICRRTESRPLGNIKSTVSGLRLTVEPRHKMTYSCNGTQWNPCHSQQSQCPLVGVPAWERVSPSRGDLLDLPNSDVPAAIMNIRSGFASRNLPYFPQLDDGCQ